MEIDLRSAGRAGRIVNPARVGADRCLGDVGQPRRDPGVVQHLAIDHRHRHGAASERGDQRQIVHDRPTRNVDPVGGLFHLRQTLRIDRSLPCLFKV